MPITTIRSTSGVITSYIDGVPLVVAPDHPGYNKIEQALREGNGKEALRLADIKTAIEDYVADPNNPDSGVKIKDGNFYYKGREIQHPVVTRIMEFAAKKHDAQPLILFFENLCQNPSGHSYSQLFRFLEHKALPITDDGCFYAYKAITHDWKDYHTRTVSNRIGEKPFMERRETDDDFSEDCGSGFHVGNIEFVKSFHQQGGRIVLVKVNPKDVVSVPKSETYKMRCNTYEVIEEISPESIGLTAPLYTGFAPVSEIPPDGDGPGWDEDDDDDEDSSWVEEDEYEEDEADEEVEISSNLELPAVLALWCENQGLVKDEFVNHFVDEGIRSAFKKRDGQTFVQMLFYHAVEDGDENLVDILKNKESVKQLVRLVQGE